MHVRIAYIVFRSPKTTVYTLYIETAQKTTYYS